MISIDLRKSWWWERQTQARLTKWAIALLQGRSYSVRLVDEGMSFVFPEEHLMQINAQMFPERTPFEQFTATQGLIAHEVGHAFFTGAWPYGDQHDRLRELSNILEDQRIENAICLYYPGIAETIRFLGDLMLGRVGPVRQAPAQQAYLCCLVWRWAQSRISEERMLLQMAVHEAGTHLWQAVKPLVEEAWFAPDTLAVIQAAGRILEILGLDPDAHPLRLPQLLNEDLHLGGKGEAGSFPSGSCQEAQPGKGKDLEAPLPFRSDRISTAKPYVELEDQAAPLANQLVNELRLPSPNTAFLPDEWGGRYSFRQEIRTPETPTLVRLGEDLSSRELAIHLLVDRSGSMSSVNETVQLSLMALYLACTQLGIHLGISFFGSNQEKDQTLLLTPPLPDAQEPVKALIAGFSGETSNEFLYWGLQEAEACLKSCLEHTKVILCIHDGEPIYHGPDGNDWELSYQAVRRLSKEGFLVIGLFLYPRKCADSCAGSLLKLAKLFPNLVASDDQQLAFKLGNFLRSLTSNQG